MEVNNILVARIMVKYNVEAKLLFRCELCNCWIPTTRTLASTVKKWMYETKCTVPGVSNLSFGEPKNVKQILWKEMEYYDFNIMDDSETKRFVGRETNKHRWRLEFEEGTEATGIGKWRISTWSGDRGTMATVSTSLNRKLMYQHYSLKRFHTLLLWVQNLIYSRWDNIPPIQA